MESRPVREVALPACGIVNLRKSLRKEVGQLAAVHCLHSAGYASGEGLFQRFQSGLGDDAGTLSQEALWARMDRFFKERGWGSLAHNPLHPGVGAVESRDWAEAEPDTETQPSCAFSTGMLSSFLTGLAGGPVAVLEVKCASRGDGICTFAFGSETVVHDLYGHLLEGASLSEALDRL